MNQHLTRLRRILSSRLQRTSELREAASLCRSLVLSDSDGAGVFLLLALYFEALASQRESSPVDADTYDRLVTEILGPIKACIDAIAASDPVRLIANLDSFARTAVRLAIP